MASDPATAHYREALRLAMYCGNLAELALERKDWLAAETLAREALPLAVAVHRQQLIANNNHRLAFALVRQGQAAEALLHARCAVDTYTRLRSPDLTMAKPSSGMLVAARAKARHDFPATFLVPAPAAGGL